MNHTLFTINDIQKLKSLASNFPRQGKSDEGFIWKSYLKICDDGGEKLKDSQRKQPPSPTSCGCHGKHWAPAQLSIARYLDKLEGNEIV